MPATLATSRPDTLNPLLIGLQTNHITLLQWTLITTVTAAYFIILGWAAIKLTRWIHTHSHDTLFHDKPPQSRRLMTTTLTACLAVLVITIGIWGYTRLIDHLTPLLF